MRRDVQLFLGKKKLNKASKGENIVSNPLISDDTDYSLVNHSAVIDGKARLTTILGGEASIGQTISGLLPNKRYQLELEGLNYPTEKLVVNRAFRSQEFNQSIWTKVRCSIGSNTTVAPDGETTADSIFNSNSSNLILQSRDFTSGEPVTISTYVKRGAATTISLFADQDTVVFNLTSNTVTSYSSRMSNSNIEYANNGWYRISCTYTPTSSATNKDFGIKNISLYQFLYIWGFQMEEGDSLGLYVKNVSDTDSSYQYVNQTEQQISNYAIYSREISNSAWTRARLSANDNQVNDFFGVNKGTRLSGTVSLGTAYAYQRIVIDEDLTDYVLTFYIKADSANYAALRLSDDKNTGSRDFFYATMDFSDGSLSSQSDSINVRFSTFEYQHSGWYKVSIGLDANNTSQFEFLFSPRFDLGGPFDAPTTSGSPSMYISNIQLEKASVEGQYIATTASSVALGKPNNTLVISDTSDGNGGLQYYTDLQAGSRSLVVDFNTGNTTGDLKIEIQDKTTTAQIEIEALSIKEIIEPFYSTEQYSVDMFDFEDLNVVDKIKDVRDISKVFTEYTQKFTVPASANNNQLFDHFYNENVVSGFDHRLKHEAVIKVGGADYKHGQLTLLSSSLKNGQPYSYSLVFYGNTVKLKDLISDDKLSDLTGTVLDNLNLEYNSTNIFNLLTYGMNFDDTDTLVANTDNGQNDPTPDVFVPFISCDSHYFYDALDEAQVKDRVSSRNVRYDSAQPTRGIYYKDLKLAVKVKYVIRAIEEKYGLKFSNDFFNENIKAYNELSLFLHKESGGISKQLETTTDTVSLGDLTKTNTHEDFRGFGRQGQNTSGWNNDYLDMYTHRAFGFSESGRFHSYRISFDITPVGSGEYTVELIDASSGSDGSSDFSFTGTGTHTLRHIFKRGTENGSNPLYEYQYVKPRFKVSTQSGITQYTIDNIEIQRVSTDVYQVDGITVDSNSWAYESGYPTYEYSSGGSTLVDIDGGVSFQSQMPNMKVLDFLTSIFKMFNLTAYFVPETDISPFAGQIRVRTLDAYYLSGKEVDISPYVDTSSSVISRNKLYSTVEFEYPDHKTLASIKQGERTGDVFGSEVMNNLEANLDNPLAFDGGKYKVKSNFEKVMYERMTDQSDSTTILPIQWGWMASKDENPVLGKALLFYPIYEDVNAVYDGEGETFELDFDTSIYDKNKAVITSNHANFSNYIRPSNSLRGNSSSLNFGSEYDEWYVWEGSGTNENSLFNRYYKNYLTSIYNIQSRLVTIDTHLPVNILMKLKLEDIVIINRKQFRINSLKLNITTGKAKLELMNDIAYSQLFVAPVSISTDWRTNVPTLGWTSQITIEDDSSNDATSYRLYSNGVFLREFSSQTVIVTDSQLTSGLNEIAITKVTNYDNSYSKESAYSNIIEITV
jgi:hypothetical protein